MNKDRTSETNTCYEGKIREGEGMGALLNRVVLEVFEQRSPKSERINWLAKTLER